MAQKESADCQVLQLAQVWWWEGSLYNLNPVTSRVISVTVYMHVSKKIKTYCMVEVPFFPMGICIFHGSGETCDFYSFFI